MKLSSKPLKFIILGTLILMMSCGKKKLGGYPYGPTYLPPNVIASLQAYQNQYICPSGRFETPPFSVAQFYQGSGNTTQIQGQPQPTAIGGIPSNTYVGVNIGTRDLIFITKMTDGGRVIGFNILLSLCRSITQPGWGQPPIPLIDSSRMPVVSEVSPFIVMDPTNCAMGSVDQGAVGLIIPPYQIPGTTRPIQGMPTQIYFARPDCPGSLRTQYQYPR